MIATHTGCIWGMPSGLDQFAACGLLGPDIVHVHCNACTERDWTLLQRSDGKISVTPETELQMGMGHPPIERALRPGWSSASAATSSPRTPATCSPRCGWACRTRGHASTTRVNALADRPDRPRLHDPRRARVGDDGRREGARHGGRHRLADTGQAGRRDRRRTRRGPAQHARPGGPRPARSSSRRTPRTCARCSSRAGRSSATAACSHVDFAALARRVEGSRDGIIERTLADGPILPEPKPSFDDIAALLLPNLNVPANA